MTWLIGSYAPNYGDNTSENALNLETAVDRLSAFGGPDE
jgi:hypothetical protein